MTINIEGHPDSTRTNQGVLRLWPYCLSAALGLLFLGYAGAQAPERLPAEFQQVAEDLYFNFDFAVSNSVVLITEEGVLVVDTRMHPRDAQLLLEEIRKRTDAPIQWVVNTQFHGDHYMGNAVFKREGARIIAHRDTRTVMEERFDFEVNNRPFEQLGYDREEVQKVLPDVLFDDRVTLELGGRTVELIYLGPGQNEGDTLVYFPHAKALHTGGVFHRQSWANASYTPSIDGWIDVLERMKGIDATIYLPPHGSVSAERDVDEFILFLSELKASVQATVDQGLSVEEMVQSLPFETYRTWRGYDRRDRNLTAIYELLTTGESEYFVPGSTAAEYAP